MHGGLCGISPDRKTTPNTRRDPTTLGQGAEREHLGNWQGRTFRRGRTLRCVRGVGGGDSLPRTSSGSWLRRIAVRLARSGSCCGEKACTPRTCGVILARWCSRQRRLIPQDYNALARTARMGIARVEEHNCSPGRCPAWWFFRVTRRRLDVTLVALPPVYAPRCSSVVRMKHQRGRRAQIE